MLAFNAQRAALDDRLKLRGEPVFLQRIVGGTRNVVQCKIPALVNAGPAQVLEGQITQEFLIATVSPTDIVAAAWPGGQMPASQSGILPRPESFMPVTTDTVHVRGQRRAIQAVNPVYDRGECIRIDLKLLG